ncbi:MAG: rod shape-determining protein MreD [Gammaproteobacteria bacterium]|nr:rod shape-determining protein MreD [Gammaproteobacteria bacterium]
MNRSSHVWLANISLLIALMLMLTPLPYWAHVCRPEWVTLTLLFWCMLAPNEIGLGLAFIYGLIVDVALGTLLGQHALGILIACYLMLRYHHIIRAYPLLQQGLIVGVILLIKQLVLLWIYGITNRAPGSLWVYFLPSFFGGLLWPWLFTILLDTQRRFGPRQSVSL